MSVLRIPIRVTRTLIAPTLTVLTAVLVNKDLMEMDSLVKVLNCENVQNSLLELSPLWWKLTMTLCVNCCVLFIMPDFDECSLEPSPCDENADCTNTDGSYSCTCKQGFTRNGPVCEGVPLWKTIHPLHPHQAQLIQILLRFPWNSTPFSCLSISSLSPKIIVHRS